MPFKSVKQRGFMFANHPGIARRWAKKYGMQPKPNNDSNVLYRGNSAAMDQKVQHLTKLRKNVKGQKRSFY